MNPDGAVTPPDPPARALTAKRFAIAAVAVLLLIVAGLIAASHYGQRHNPLCLPGKSICNGDTAVKAKHETVNEVIAESKTELAAKSEQSRAQEAKELAEENTRATVEANLATETAGQTKRKKELEGLSTSERQAREARESSAPTE
jgi:hypothetical protein